MADISMCSNKICPKKKECYRQQAKPTGYGSQSYANFVFVQDKKTGHISCEHYLNAGVRCNGVKGNTK